MRIKVEVELAEKEMGSAQQVLAALQSVCDNVEARMVTDDGTLASLLRDGVESGRMEGALQEASRRFSRPELAQDCMDVLCSLMFDPQRTDPVQPYVMFITRLPDEIRYKVRDETSSRVLKFLAKPRQLDAPRTDLLPYAETLAALVKVEAVPLLGAISTVVHLLRTEHTRCAAITTLGKMVEMCSEVITERCEAEMMHHLRQALGASQDDCFLYDVEYIMEHLGWSQPPNPREATQLMLSRTCRHHQSSIYAMAYGGPPREIVVTSSLDGSIVTWDPSGNPIETFVLARHYACALDLASHGRSLLLCGVSKSREDTVPPAVVFYGCDDAGRWAETGALERKGIRIVSCVKALNRNVLQFCTGETSDSFSPVTTVCIYDASRTQHHLQPVREFHDHADIVTALAVPPDRDSTLWSGSRDCGLLLYDVRMPQAAGSTYVHTGTVTSIATFQDFVISGGLDKRVVVHDVRMLHQPVAVRDMDSGVLKVAVAPQGVCAAATLTSLHVLNLTTQHLHSSKVDGQAAGARYHDVAWNAAQNVLYAVGDNMSLDVYSTT